MRWRRLPRAEVAARIARTLLCEPHGTADVPGRVYPLAGFQEAAVRRARRALARRGGVVVADEVGLGKTYVALALMEEELRQGSDVAVVVPAALAPTWAPLLRRLGRAGRRPAAVYATTHTRLSRGTHDAVRLAAAALVVVDEAHAFRNPDTRRYRALAARARGGRLLLITATPVNNAAADLYHLIRQFAADDAFHDLGVASLRAAFLEGGTGGAPGDEAMRIVREVVVRRTREQVDAPAHDARGTDPVDLPARFPARAPTRILRYEDRRLPELVAGIQRLELPPYDGAVEALVRLGLLKRLESGSGALASSLRRLRALLVAFAGAADAGRLLRPADRQGRGRRGNHGSADAGDGDAIQLVLDTLVLEPAPPGTDLPGLAASARRDLDTVAGMLRRLKEPDPKLAVLLRWAGTRNSGEKAVIFTELRDTAAALWRGLLPLGHVGRVDGGGAWLGARRSGRRVVVERFAPVSSGARPPADRERVDLLVATDVLGEGMNLQDAAVVVSYDLPWNPVRLLQRIGRVDRLGSLHARVQPLVFVPGAGLDDVLRLTRSLRAKLGGIAATVGATDAGELLARLGGRGGAGGMAEAGRGAGDAGARDPLEALRPPGDLDPWQRLRACVADDGPRAGDSSRPLLGVRRRHRRWSGPGEWLVLVRRADGVPELVAVARDGRSRPAGPEAAGALERLLQARDAGTDAHGAMEEESAGPDAAAAAALRHLRDRADSADAPAPLPRHGPEARLAREIRRAIAGMGPAPDPALLRLSDSVLRRLARPLGPATLARLERAWRHPARRGGGAAAGAVELRKLLARVRGVLEGDGPGAEAAQEPGRSRGLRDSVEPEVLAVLQTPPDRLRTAPRSG